MKIEKMTVKVLRTVDRFSNDSTELTVSLEEGDDWKQLECMLRQQAVSLINAHWKEKRMKEEEARKKEREEREAIKREVRIQRDEHLKLISSNNDSDVSVDPCVNCPGRIADIYVCDDGCEHYDGIPF